MPGSKLPAHGIRLTLKILAVMRPRGQKLFHFAAVTDQQTDGKTGRRANRHLESRCTHLGSFFLIYLCMGGWETSNPGSTISVCEGKVKPIHEKHSECSKVPYFPSNTNSSVGLDWNTKVSLGYSMPSFLESGHETFYFICPIKTPRQRL